MIDVNRDLYGSSSLFVGITGLLYTPGASDLVEDILCSTNAPQCTALASTLNQTCPPDRTALSTDSFAASAGFGSLVTLSQSETQYSSGCDTMVRSWNPTSTLLALNDDHLQSLAGGIVTGDSLVVVQFHLQTPRIAQTTFNPLSGQSMFGSLSGWFGFLTDGWGIISVVFLCERTYLYVRDRYFG